MTGATATRCLDNTAFLAARDRGERCEIPEDLYDYYLDVLPPRFMGRRVVLNTGQVQYAAFGFAEGVETITAFWREGDCHYAQHTVHVSRGD